MKIDALKEGEKLAKVGIFKLLALGILKITAFFITGMTVILADAISTFADTLGLFATFFGLKMSRKSENDQFGYGYYKVETFMALVISLGIIYLGYIIFKDSIDTIKNPVEGQFRSFAMTTTVITIVMSYFLYKRLIAVGHKINSLSLLANARDKKMDVFSGFAVLASIYANYKGIPYFEGVVSMLISLIILKEGVVSTKESLFYLLDYWDDPVLKSQIKKVLLKDKGLIKQVRKIRLRRAGTFIFGEAFIEVNSYADLVEIRDELSILQEKIKSLSPYIRDFSILTHFQKHENLKVALPIKRGNDLNAYIATSLKETKAYLFAEIRDAKIKKYYTIKLNKEDKKVLSLAKLLKKEKIQILIDNDLSSLLYYNLRKTNHIQIYPNFSDIKTAEETLKLLLLDT